MILYYIRHGDPIYSPDSLTELGKRQAEAVAKRLALHGIDEIYASTSNRAVLTATPLSEIVKKPITQLDWCNENHAWRDFTVKSKDGNTNWLFEDSEAKVKLRSKDTLLLGDKWYADSFFEEKVGNGIKRIDTEVDNFFESLGYTHDRENATYKMKEKNEKRIALFAHQGFSMAFLSSVLDIPYPLFASRFDITHTGVSVIYFPNNDNMETAPIMLEHSNDSHLYKEGLPTKFNNCILI